MYPTILGMPSYIVLAVVGFIAAFLTAFFRRKNYNFTPMDIVSMLCLGIAGLLIGAKLLFIVTMIPEIVQNFGWEIIEKRVINGGLVFYGGLIGAMIGIKILAKTMKRDPNEMMNFVIPCFAAFHFFGRIGCFLEGCCHGVAWANGFECDADFMCFPIQLVEAAGIAVIFAVLLYLEGYGKKTDRRVPLVHIYFVLYGVLRFIDEIWRGDVLRGVTEIRLDYFTSAENSASLAFSLSTSQIISLILIIYSGTKLYKMYRKKQ
ncbi:MAG: prolipoprotein diacylglyceryl transferase [Ruminococcaceae bacterium]|nr:prolipoprotein diacylglyceryl transferase [Oscillospiraceae bacterium]